MRDAASAAAICWLLDDLIRRPIRDPDGLRSRARRIGVDLDAPHIVVATGDSVEDGLRQRAISWARTFAATRGGLGAAALVLCRTGVDRRAVPDETYYPASICSAYYIAGFWGLAD